MLRLSFLMKVVYFECQTKTRVILIFAQFLDIFSLNLRLFIRLPWSLFVLAVAFLLDFRHQHWPITYHFDLLLFLSIMYLYFKSKVSLHLLQFFHLIDRARLFTFFSDSLRFEFFQILFFRLKVRVSISITQFFLRL